ncbi:hypothetical protein AYO21_02065 [Fonsecaea monophora]|uniref:Uncharacterized protein n=1 Tax=Fonsecaea monophora TaxID=254056 RepID=A0A177FHV7_9EURO|nr:hypothetical protein AYO21_02065 [Fonsecaea monophora]OAG43838.1 hypothetical protein AYO21_02065 [Fonsecaea monophora]
MTSSTDDCASAERDTKSLLLTTFSPEDEDEDFVTSDDASDGEGDHDDSEADMIEEPDELDADIMELATEIQQPLTDQQYEAAGIENPSTTLLNLEDESEDGSEDGDYDSEFEEELPDEEMLDADEEMVMNDERFDENGRNAARRQERICRALETLAEEAERLREQGMEFVEEEHDFSSAAYQNDAVEWEYIPCKRGTFDGNGNELTAEQMEESFDPSDMDYCPCRFCRETQRSERNERYERRCAQKETTENLDL